MPDHPGGVPSPDHPGGVPSPDHPGARPPPQPLDPPMVPFAVAGLGGWAIAGLAVAALDGPPSWLRICVAGFLLGIPGLAIMIAHDRRRTRRRSPGGDRVSAA